jgi:hypothetical protein
LISFFKEWIPAFKLAKHDKLEKRQPGRSTIRPAPPNEEQEVVVEVGTAVDARWSDGWWDGVVTTIDNCGDDSVQVYFPGMLFYRYIYPFSPCLDFG